MKDLTPAQKEHLRHFEVFSRIGRWGGCVDCPTSAGKQYPEFCVNTERYDHQLDVWSLAVQHIGRRGSK